MELTTTLKSVMRRTKLVKELDPVSTPRSPKEQQNLDRLALGIGN